MNFFKKINFNIMYGKFHFSFYILLIVALTSINIYMPVFAAENTIACCKNSRAIAYHESNKIFSTGDQLLNTKNIGIENQTQNINHTNTTQNTENIQNTQKSKDIQTIRIRIKNSASVNTRKIYLGDISEIKMPDSISLFIKKKLEKISMGFAPRPGQFKILNGNHLRARINSEKFLPENISVIIPERVFIKRKSQEIPRKRLKKIFLNYISGKTDHMDFTIRNFTIRGLKVYPDGKLSMPLCENDNDREIRGRVTLYLQVMINNKNYGKIALSGWVDIFDTVLCAASPLARGTVLSSNDVYMERRSISKFSGNYFKTAAHIQGKVLKTSISRGRCITENMVEDSPLVHRGELVKMVAAAGALKIVTTGIAKNDGRLNDQIRVENMDSSKIVYGIVMGKSRVKVLY